MAEERHAMCESALRGLRLKHAMKEGGSICKKEILPVIYSSLEAGEERSVSVV